MTATNVIAVFLAAAALACSSDAKSPSTAGAGNGAQAGAAAAACLDLSGTWTIASHCSTALVGTEVMVTQTACSFTTSGSFPGFNGMVKQDSSVSLSGTASGMSVSCTGSATAHSLTESCTGNCSVTLTR